MLKNREQQQERTRAKAEVFTPSWICNKMNNHCDEEWFGRKDVFNVERNQEWQVNTEKVEFDAEDGWKKYVDSKRLEITCGEAPYIVSRYDAATGELLEIKRRIGILDRKLRVVNENTVNEKEWFKWVDEGHEIFVVTGRPFDSYEPSRRWLDEHHLNRIPIYFVDKYGREMFKQDHTYNLTLEELYCMHFDFAIEDSPAAFEHVQHFKDCKVAVYDRPWNKQVEFPDESFVRCLDWQEIDRLWQQQAAFQIADLSI